MWFLRWSAIVRAYLPYVPPKPYPINIVICLVAKAGAEKNKMPAMIKDDDILNFCFIKKLSPF